MKYWAVSRDPEFLEHYGVKGMKWRHHKSKNKRENRPYDSNQARTDYLMNRWGVNYDPTESYDKIPYNELKERVTEYAVRKADDLINKFIRIKTSSDAKRLFGKDFAWTTNNRNLVDKVGEKVIRGGQAAARTTGRKPSSSGIYEVPTVNVTYGKDKKVRVRVR